MGSGASSTTTTGGAGNHENTILSEGEMVDQTKNYCQVLKGSPACRSGYDIGYKIGEGSFAVVRIGVSYKTKTKFAIKEIYTSDFLPEQLDDLEREINILSQFRHNNIVRLHEIYRDDKATYMICEYLSGGELFDAICEQEFYKENDARRVMTSITNAILYMHSHGVMHRDLKPENLILCSNSADTDLKLIDFGFATRFGPGIQQETRLCGTPGYVAPEMLRGAPYGGEVDMWSLGVIMYVLLAGMPPFSSDNGTDLFASIQTANFSYPDEYWSDISAGAKDLINHLLVIDQRKRYTVQQVLNHSWMKNEIIDDRNLVRNLAAMKEWNASRKMVVSTLAVKSCVKFRLAGKRYKDGLISAAKRAKELESKGISWELSAEEIAKRESMLNSNKLPGSG
mmetsp:Transcript_7544/g.7989  ORF Transcript_7544/g.7989 Transcript_7544/m.7989 type:complete len:397 (-) Transcript_7544:564-1754(-)